MSPPHDNGIPKSDISDASGHTQPASTNEIRITKNYSTSNLFTQSSASMAMRGSRNRQSLDVSSMGMFEDKLSKSPIIPDHAGEHGLGPGLRRIRQPAANVQTPNSSGSPVVSRSGSLTLSMPSRQPSVNIPSAPTSPALNFSEDLTRFPTESLHSFSFTHQSEESLHNRQNVLKRSIDFMRDKLGWAASNPGLVSAQARLAGDAEVQSMIELLARAQLIGEDAHQAHGLGIGGPLTGPADIAGGNVFDRTFGNVPRSESPDSVGDPDEPHSLPRDAGMTSNASRSHIEQLAPHSTEQNLESLNESEPSSGQPPSTSVPTRAALKRTFTNLDDLTVQHKLSETLAQPYSVHDDHTDSVIAPKAMPTASTVISPITAHPQVGPRSAGPHVHGSRWAPAPQAIFTTEANAPWTITAANDLACLVFGVTRAEVRKLGILEVVKEERRKWLEEKLRDPDAGSMGKTVYSASQRGSPSATTSLNVGSGITARLLSKPSSRQTAAGRRSKTEDGSGGYSNRSKVKGGVNHQPKKSRGVLLCGDVVPIQKRNGAFGSASLWVKEKKGGLIWVLEEIAEDVAFIGVDEVGCITKAQGALEVIWGSERVRRGMDIKRLIPDIPRIIGTNTGALNYDLIAELRAFTARTSNSINIPVTVEQISGEPTFRVSSFPHIAGIMVLDSQTLNIQSSNTVFSSALFGQSHPEGLHVNEILPGFDKVLNLMTDEDKIRLVDGIVIPEHSFRRARALLAMREGKADAAAVFLRPSGLPAKHRDGSDISVDVQMRVVKSERSIVEDEVIVEEDEGHPHHMITTSEVVYALWITYSRQLHAANHGIGPVTPSLSRPASPPRQPSPGQSGGPLLPQEIDSDQPVSLLTKQLKGTKSSVVTGGDLPTPETTPSPDPTSQGPPLKKTINDFVVLEDMGQGAYGQVKLCRYKKNSPKKVVIKYVTKRRILVDTWTRDRRLGTVPLEIHVLDYLRRDGLKHANIVEMTDFFEDDVNYYIEMVPHGLPGMDLFDYIELRVNMDEEECRKIFVQVAEAIRHLHVKARVVHRDIKDENVILDGEGNIKLIDFGSAAYIKNGPFDVFVGTIDYAAPEVLAGRSYRGKEQDVWALGILLYTIIYKENPFYSIDEIMDHDLRVPYVMSEASIDLVRLMLNRDVDQRITISEVLDHRWCQGEGADMDGQ